MPRLNYIRILWFFTFFNLNSKGSEAGKEYQNEDTPVQLNQRNKREILEPGLNVSVSWNGSQSLSSGDELVYNSCIQHTSSMSADASNVRLNWLFPSYITFHGIYQTVGSEIMITHLQSSVVKLQISHLLQHEKVCFRLVFIFDPTSSRKAGRHFIVTHTQLSWAGSPGSTGHTSSRPLYTSPWDIFSVAVEVPGCSSELGIGNGKVKDYQITASSYIPGYEPFRARINGSSEWCAAILDYNQFLQVDFIHQVRITKISVHGDNPLTGVERYILEYSLDNHKWENYTEYGTLKVFRKDLVNTHWILNPFEAYNIRLRPTSWNTSMCLKVELYGCEDPQSPASCNIPLGMESGFITDDALSTSQESGDNNQNPWDSRLNKIVRDHLSHGWLASPYIAEDYLQIDFAVLYTVTKIGVQGSWTETPESAISFVRKYIVTSSNDSLVWSNYTENGRIKLFDGPSIPAMAPYPTFAILARPVVTRYIRIFPQPLGGYRVMRLEIYGCLNEPMPSYAVSKDFSRRSYLLNNKTGCFYVCLYTKDSTESSCMYTKDGYSWKSLNSQIVTVLAIDSVKDIIFGVDRSNSFVRSPDFGANYVAISPTQWKKVKASSQLTLARKVPENLLAKDHINGDILMSNNRFQWTVSNTGVHLKRPGEDWVVIATWKCCGH